MTAQCCLKVYPGLVMERWYCCQTECTNLIVWLGRNFRVWFFWACQMSFPRRVFVPRDLCQNLYFLGYMSSVKTVNSGRKKTLNGQGLRLPCLRFVSWNRNAHIRDPKGNTGKDMRNQQCLVKAPNGGFSIVFQPFLRWLWCECSHTCQSLQPCESGLRSLHCT